MSGNQSQHFHLPLFGTIKNKPVPKRKIALRRVLYNTRGTTQIADIKIRHLFEVCQLLYTNAAFTGNVYWVFKPLGLPAQKGEVQVPCITDSHLPSVLWNAFALPILRHSLCLRLYHTMLRLSIPFLKKMILISIFAALYALCTNPPIKYVSY